MASAPHPQTERFLEFLAACAPPGQTGQATIEELRDRARPGVPPGGSDGRVHAAGAVVAGPGHAVSVRVYRPVCHGPRRPLPALVYLHGGGFVLGDLDSVDGTCRELAAGADCTVVSVDYRLAPEHPFPAAVGDAWAVTAAVAADPDRYGADARAIAVAGDSAGANLAAVAALRARDRGVRLAHQLLVYPVTDTARDTVSYARYGRGYGLDAASMEHFMGLYAGDADPGDPELAPLRAPDLSGLAPATVITAEYDVLRDEGEAYARRMAEAGVPVAARRFAGMVHSFFLLPEIFDAGAEARAWAVARLRAAFATALEELEET